MYRIFHRKNIGMTAIVRCLPVCMCIYFSQKDVMCVCVCVHNTVLWMIKSCLNFHMVTGWYGCWVPVVVIELPLCVTFQWYVSHGNHMTTWVTYLLTYLLTYLFTYLLTYSLTHSLTHSLTYCLLTPWSRVLLEKLTGFQLVKKFPAFYGTWRFITAYTHACHLSLSWQLELADII